MIPSAVTVAHISDLHMLSLASLTASGLMSKRLTGAGNLLLKRSHVHRPAYVRELFADISSLSPSLVVVTGDVSNLALDSEFRLVRDTLHECLNVPAHRVLVVPGNHDVYTRGSAKSHRFASHLGEYLGSDRPELCVSTHGGNFPVLKVHGPLAVIGLSSAVPRPPFVASGRLGTEQRSRLARLLALPEVRDRQCIVALHHPAANPKDRWRARLEGLDDADELQALLDDHPRVIVLHGHLHRSLRRRVGRHPLFGATSASLHHDDGTRHAAYNLYRFNADGTLLGAEARTLGSHGLVEVREYSDDTPKTTSA